MFKRKARIDYIMGRYISSKYHFIESVLESNLCRINDEETKPLLREGYFRYVQISA